MYHKSDIRLIEFYELLLICNPCIKKNTSFFHIESVSRTDDLTDDNNLQQDAIYIYTRIYLLINMLKKHNSTVFDYYI